MRNVLIFFLTLVYYQLRSTSAQVDTNQIIQPNDPGDEWDFVDNSTESTKSKSEKSGVANRLFPENNEPTKNGSEKMLDEFHTDLMQIKQIAQKVSPITTNVRRSMQSRRSSEFRTRILKGFSLNILINLIGALEKFVPALLPVTKYVRQILIMMLS